MPRQLVTGGAGFIGSNLVRALIARGDSVRVLDNLSTGRAENLDGLGDSIEFIEGDIRKPSTVRRAVKGVQNVFHVAALPSVARSTEDPMTSNDVNVTGTLNVLIAARDAKIRRLVFSSSSSVYGDTPTLPKREDMKGAPKSPYAVQKAIGEYYCSVFHDLYGLKTFSLRYFNVFGPRQNPKSQYAAVIPLFARALLEGRAPVIHGTGEQTRDFTYVEDVVSANMCCCSAPESAAGSVYNVACGNRVSILELATALMKITGVQIPPEFGPARPGDVRDSQGDSTLARERLSWKPAWSFEDGLRMTVEFLKAQP